MSTDPDDEESFFLDPETWAFLPGFIAWVLILAVVVPLVCWARGGCS